MSDISATTPPIFDGHNDVLLKLFMGKNGADVAGFASGCAGHIDVPRAQAGGFGGGFFAMFVPSPMDGANMMQQMMQPSYDLPLPDPLKQASALKITLAQADILHALEAQGSLEICTSTAAIRACLASGKLAAILHLEGAEAISPDLAELDDLYARGLRSLGPVWSRPTIFADGVPFRFPATPDIGGGLTDAGRALVKRCNALGVMLDLSHLNEAGFWDVAALSDAPLVATHSNAHAICAHARNLTDRQLAAIRDTGGMVGLNFAVAFLRPDGIMEGDTPLETMLRHLDYLMAALGEDHVGFGSDFDGAVVPAEIADVAGLPALRAAMRDHGYDDALMQKLCFDNWLGVLDRSWKA